jgi:hypothetical protein
MRTRSVAVKIGAAVLAALCAIAAGAASAAVDVACVSLIGDALTTIERQSTSGSNLTRRGGVANPDAAHARDKLAASTAMTAITTRNPTASAVTVEVSGRGTERFYTTPLANINDQSAIELYGQLASSVAKQVQAKQVLVIAKLEFRHWSEPYVLSGIGVFAEPGPRDMPINDESVERRYLAPYLGAARLLFNADGRIVASQALALHTTHRSERGKTIPATVWQILSAEQLNTAVNQLVAEGVGTAAGRLPL